MGDTIWDWDKTAANNATADSAIDWSEGQLPSTVNNSAREMMAKIAYLLEDISSSLVTGGTGNAYTVSPGKPPSDLTKGWIGVVRFDRANTGAATFQVGSLTAASLVDAEGNALSGGEIVANGIYIVSYNPTNAKFHLVNRVPLHADEVGTTEISDTSVTPAKIDSTQNYTFGQITSEGNSPRLILSESDTTTVARVMLEGGVTYIQPGAAGSGTTASSGDLALCGLGYTDLNSFKVKTGGVWGNVWHDNNFAARIAALTANTSPAGTESVACDDGQKVTLQAIADMSGADFVSGQTAFTNTGQTTVAHGLGAVPSRVAAFLVATATTTTNGYSQGDIVKLGHCSHYDVSVWADSTNAGLTTINSPRIPNKSGTTYDTLCDSTEWAVIFMAWK